MSKVSEPQTDNIMLWFLDPGSEFKSGRSEGESQYWRRTLRNPEVGQREGRPTILL